MKCFLILLGAATAIAQSPSLPHVVLTRLPGSNPAALLVEVDSTIGTVQTLARFPSDVLPPLAVASDSYDGAVLVALDPGGGQSRIVRLVRTAGGFAEFPLAVLPGRVSDMCTQSNELLVAVDAPSGGIYRIDRRLAGAPIHAMTLANVTALHYMPTTGTFAVVAWTGRPGTAAIDSGTAMVDYGAGAYVIGPYGFPNPGGTEITGVFDLPTAVPRQLLSFDDGTFATFIGPGGPLTVPVATTPPLPVGGAAALHATALVSSSALAVGGASYPFLYEVSAWTGVVTPRSTALPGSPVDFAIGIATRNSVSFGVSCGPTGLLQHWNGVPTLGGTLSIEVMGPANAWALLAGGLDDFAGGALPVLLPGGCPLEVLPEAVALYQLGASGVASHGLVIPGAVGLFGLPVFFQWAHVDIAGFSTSNAVVHWLGN